MRRPRLTSLVIPLACVVLAGWAPVSAAEPDQHTPNKALVSELRASGARIDRHAATGQVRFIGGSRARPAAGRELLGHPATVAVAADRFLARYGPLFGVAKPGSGLRQVRAVSAPGGGTFVRYQQVHRGVPVLGGEITIQVAEGGDVISAIGEAAPGLELAAEPQISAADALTEALAAIARVRGIPATELRAAAAELWIYDPALLGGRGLPFAQLVWRTEVENLAGDMRELVLVDASQGSVALHFDQIAHARNRITCDGGGTVSGSTSKYPCTSGAAARTETSAATGIDDVDRAHEFAGHTYDFFFNRFGRDSIDGSGMALVSTVRYCSSVSPCPFENAFWDGSQMVYGTGYAGADDVVGHELTHGITQYSSGLFYYYQSGAINEALSDIFGEYIDLTNGAGTDTAGNRWLLGEDLPIGAIRDMEDPGLFGSPDRMRSPNYWASESDAGGVHSNNGVANKAAFLMVDGASFNGQTVAGLGIDKAAAIWYRVATSYLGSASDYADLGSALNQACTDLIGTTPKQGNGSPSASGAISAANCTEVAEAVLATEMALQPTLPGAAAPEAPLCPSGTPTITLFDNLENTSSGNWTSAAISGGNGWYYPQNTHPYTGFDATYATSGTTNLWGYNQPVTTDSAITMTAGVTLPAKGFLHFDHAYGFEDDISVGPQYRWDGGVVEYQVAGGSWTDVGALVSVNGYNGTISTLDTNPLKGRSAFTAQSNGYISSRYDLSTLAGKSVKFRFRIGTDSTRDDFGWFIDDFRIYSCATVGGDTTAPAVTAPDVRFRTVPLNTGKKPVNLNASFTASDTSGIADTTLQQSVNGAAFTDMALATATATGKDFKAKVSKTITRRVRARATDGAGNTSAFATGPLFKVRGHQNGAAAVIQTGSWTTASNSNFFKGSVRHTSVAGRKQSITRTATDLAIVSTLGPNRGKAAVYVDGVQLATIDLYKATKTFRQVVYAISFPTAGSHTIELRVLGTRNAASSGNRVDFDAFLSMGP